MSDAKTLDVYAARAAEYDARFSSLKANGDLTAFVAALPAGDLPVLDWGCGGGASARRMAALGMRVEATDAVPQMVDIARGYGIDARAERFDALDARAAYRGVWANFSLLHAPHADMPDNLARAHRALVPGGILHVGVKAGTGSRRDGLGRLYHFWDEPALRDAVATAGFAIVSVRRGRETGFAGTDDPFLILLARSG